MKGSRALSLLYLPRSQYEGGKVYSLHERVDNLIHLRPAPVKRLLGLFDDQEVHVAVFVRIS